MLRLSRLPHGPAWVELVGGAAVLALPPSTPLVYAARAHAESLLADLVSSGEAVTRAGGYIAGVPDLASDEQRDGTKESLFVVSLAELAVTDWRGVADADGEPLEFRPAGLVHLLSDAVVADAFRRNYLKPIHEVVLEGNVSRPLPSGTSGRAGAKPTAKAAKRRVRPAPRPD